MSFDTTAPNRAWISISDPKISSLPPFYTPYQRWSPKVANFPHVIWIGSHVYNSMCPNLILQVLCQVLWDERSSICQAWWDNWFCKRKQERGPSYFVNHKLTHIYQPLDANQTEIDNEQSIIYIHITFIDCNKNRKCDEWPTNWVDPHVESFEQLAMNRGPTSLDSRLIAQVKNIGGFAVWLLRLFNFILLAKHILQETVYTIKTVQRRFADVSVVRILVHSIRPVNWFSFY